MAVDDHGGVSKSGTMPWPKNSKDLKWFKQNTTNSLVIMGRLTWSDPMMPKPLKNRINVLITNKSPLLLFIAYSAASSPVILPHTIHSEVELAPKRLEPCTLLHATSPAAQTP